MPARSARLPLQGSHLLRLRFPTPSGRLTSPPAGPTTPVALANSWFGLLPPRSPLLRESRLISLRRATEMFQFAHCPSSCLFYSAGDIQTSLWMGCPIRILKDRRSHAAPLERFAGLRVLRRPSAPRHPPRTLSRLCSPGLALLAPVYSFPLHLLSLVHPGHAHSRVPLLLSLLSSCLGNIEVIMFIQFLSVQIRSPRPLESGNQPAPGRNTQSPPRHSCLSRSCASALTGRGSTWDWLLLLLVTRRSRSVSP
jgi:hypothetical protein